MPRSNRPFGSSPHASLAGCVIVLAALAVILFLLVFSIRGLLRQSDAIVQFTADKQVPVAVSELDGHEGEINTLAEKLEGFRQELAGEEEATLALTPEEMNLAIAAYEPFTDLRGTFRVLAVEGESLKIGISFKLNGKPRFARKGESGWISSDPRYLNATLTARPRLLHGELVLELKSIAVPDAKVPPGFIERMSPYRVAQRYVADPVIGPAMGKLTSVQVDGNRLLLLRNSGQTPNGRITNAQVDAASSRLFKVLGIVTGVFLVLVGFLLFRSTRSKRRNA